MRRAASSVTSSLAGAYFSRPYFAKEYTPDDLTRCIYNPDEGEDRVGSRLLNVNEIISLEDGSVLPKGLFRFLTDIRAKLVDVMMLVTVVAAFGTFPFTFIWGGSWEDPALVPGHRSLLRIDMGIDLVYAICLLLQFNMSYLQPRRNVEVVSRERICRRLISSPLYWASLISCTTYIWIFAGASTLLNNWKLVRVRHFLELPDSMWRLRDCSAVRLLRPVLLLVGCSHWVACLLAYFGGYREALLEVGAEAYETSFENSNFDGHYSLYLMALVEALYMLTGALDNPIGDGSPRERKFGALLMVSVFGPIGCVVVSLIISSIVREQGMANALSARHEENKAFMTHALRILGIPKPLRSRVLSLHYYQKMGHDKEAFDALFNRKNLSPALENALLVYLYRDTVCTSTYFLNKDPNYILEVLRVLEFQVFLPGDYVARRGEIASAMYFVSKGTLAILVPDQEHENKRRVSRAKLVRELNSGEHFGEVALVDDCVRTAWVRAESYALLSALMRNKIEPIWKHFPNEKAELHRMVLEHHRRDKQRLNQHRWRKGIKTVMEGVQHHEVMQPCPEEVDEVLAAESGEIIKQSAVEEAKASLSGARRRDPTHVCGEGCCNRDVGAALVQLQSNMAELVQRQSALEQKITGALGEIRALAYPRRTLGPADVAEGVDRELRGRPAKGRKKPPRRGQHAPPEPPEGAGPEGHGCPPAPRRQDTGSADLRELSEY